MDKALETMLANLEKNTGKFNAMCTHRVRLEQSPDLTPDVFEWLKAAYDQAG